MMDCLVVLEGASRIRPKGLIMDPTRQVLEAAIELLQWHQRSREIMERMLSKLRGHDGHTDDRKGTISSLIHDEVYILLLEGGSIVELFSQQNKWEFVSNASSSWHILEGSVSVA